MKKMHSLSEDALSEISGSSEWTRVMKIDRGWSSDEKYLIETRAGESMLLRISDGSAYEKKKREYTFIKRVSQLEIEQSKPLAFGSCDQGKQVYMLLSWVEGQDLERALPELPEAEQYQLGCRAGEILRRIHEMPVERSDRPTESKKEKKLRQIGRYETSNVRVEHDEEILQYIKDHADAFDGKKQVYQHGDFHPGNLILTSDHEIGVIDFNRWSVGDPYEEFYKLESFGTEISIPYCIGQIEGYFQNNIPAEFWERLVVYVAHASLSSIKWAEKFGQADMDKMKIRFQNALQHYDNFKRVVPLWYERSHDYSIENRK